jgi:hypothetical protein
MGRAWRRVLVVMALLVLGVGIVLALPMPWGRGQAQSQPKSQANCTVIVQPGESLQQAIDQVPAGAVICLREGMWKEHIRLHKSLTLRGAGPTHTYLQGPTLDDPVINIDTEAIKRASLEITLEGFTGTLRGAKIVGEDIDIDAGGIHIWAPGSRIKIRNIHIVDAARFGIATGGAQVEIQDVKVSQSGVGISVRQGFVMIQGAQLNNNWIGLYAGGAAQIRVEDSTIADNQGSGISISDAVQLWLERSTVSGNGNDGLTINGFVSHEVPQVRIISSQIKDNGTGDDCRRPGPRDFEICNGIEVIGDVQLAISGDSWVGGNADWGIAAWARACGYDADRLGAQVLLEGEVTSLRGNNRLGNHASNFGHHLGQHPQAYIEPGNVCLPPPPPPDCTASIAWGQPIQPFIDQAPEGAVLCLIGTQETATTWYENLLITKSLTLRGVARDQTIIRGIKVGLPVMRIRSNLEIEVHLEHLSLVGSLSSTVGSPIICPEDEPCEAYGLEIQGHARVYARDIAIRDNDLRGLVISGSAHLYLEESTIAHNGWEGLVAWGDSQVHVRDVVFSGNLAGIWVAGDVRFEAVSIRIAETIVGLYASGRSRVQLEGATISTSQQALHATESARLTLIETMIQQNTRGVLVTDQAGLILEDVTISENQLSGLEVKNYTVTSVWRGLIESNGQSELCTQRELLCNGLTAAGHAQVVLWGTKIRGNTDWGVAVQAQLCGFDQGDFSGHVSIVSEDIENNNAGGNQNGLGNPGDHPFKSLSDGQVCLP